MRTLSFLACIALLACGGGSKKKTAPPPPPDNGGATAGGGDKTPPPPPADKPAKGGQKSLYERLGGQDAITAVVAEFVGRTTTDPRIKFRFFNTDAENLKKLLVEFVCMATGGPCKYTGRSMEESHAGMDLVDEEFTALVEDLSGALDKFKVPDKEKGELLGALGPLKPAIVVSPDKLKPIDDKKLATVTKLAGTIKDKDAQEYLNMAVTAGKRGQRNYAEQMFSLAEMKVGAKAVAAAAPVFRAEAPARVTAAPKKIEDKGAQPKQIGSSDADEPDKKPLAGQLSGKITVGGKAPDGLGVVMLFPEKGGKKRTAKTRIIEQRNKEFAPHVMAVPVGSTVQFPNYDPIFHNVFSLSKVKPFDLGMYKNGESREVKLDKAGIVRLGCNLHANMSAYLIVVDAPHYAVVDSDGSFSFKSLAPGKYKVQAWNERSGEPVTSTVEVKAGANETKVDLAAGTVTVSPDKFNQPRK
jgi:hemoglobin